MILFIGNVQNRQIHTDSKWISGCQGLRGTGEWGISSNKQSFFQGQWNALNLKSDVGFTTQIYEENTELYTEKAWILWCALSVNKAVI